MQQLEKQVWELIEPGVNDLGLHVVRIRLSGGVENAVLQIMIEPEEAAPHNRVSVTLEQCEKVSRMASALLDVEDLVTHAYRLEVSSTGMERPLVTKEDFDLYAGQRTKLELLEAVDGRKRFTGTLMGMKEEEILLRDDNGEDCRLPYMHLKSARLIVVPQEMEQDFTEKQAV